MSLRGVLCLNRVMCTASLTGTKLGRVCVKYFKGPLNFTDAEVCFSSMQCEKINVMCSH